MEKAITETDASDGTVGKAMTMLDLVASFERPVRFSEILAKSKHPKATVYRLLQTLTNQAMLNYDQGSGTYIPGIRLVRLAHAAWRQSALAPIARPILDKLATELSETLHLAQMDDGRVLYVDKRNAEMPVEMFSAAGKTGPGYCTGIGKAMLAFMPQDEQEKALKRQSFHRYTASTLVDISDLKLELYKILHTGVAFDREEHEPGIICIAVPILNTKGHSIGALSLTSTTTRHSLSTLLEYQQKLKEAARKISDAAKNWQFPT